MTDAGPAAAPRPEARARRRFRLPMIWLVPIVAAAIALWLGYRTLSERGPTITIDFATADGLVAGKTLIKFKDVQLGVVQSITLSEDLTHVTATAQMVPTAEPHLTEGARFWVVTARIGLSGVSGLDTLVSGAYIALDPGRGEPARHFTGLEEPPVVVADVAGTTFLLQTDRLGSLGLGSPVFFRDLEVGQILGYDTADIETSVTVHAFVRAPFDRYVHAGTRFWNASGINVTAGPSGFKIEMQSLTAVLEGGVTFDTPATARAGDPSPEGTQFTLYKDAESVQDATYTIRVPYLVEFDESVQGLEAGSPVQWQGIKIGEVTDVRLRLDTTTAKISVPVTIEIEPQRMEVVGALPQTADGTLMGELVARGLRAQLRSASLITGQLVVALDFFPDAPAAELGRDDRYLVIPTVPSDLEGIIRSVDQIVARIAALPLEGLIGDARGTLEAIRALASASDLTSAIDALSTTLLAAGELMRTVNTDIPPVLQGLPQLIRSVRSTALSVNESYGDESSFRRNLLQLMAQAEDALRAVRVLAVLLEEHPEVLLRGKAGE